MQMSEVTLFPYAATVLQPSQAPPKLLALARKAYI